MEFILMIDACLMPGPLHPVGKRLPARSALLHCLAPVSKSYQVGLARRVSTRRRRVLELSPLLERGLARVRDLSRPVSPYTSFLEPLYRSNRDFRTTVDTNHYRPFHSSSPPSGLTKRVISKLLSLEVPMASTLPLVELNGDTAERSHHPVCRSASVACPPTVSWGEDTSTEAARHGFV